MSVVVYQCDTCIREIEIVRNEQGLDIINRCVITHGCKGSLRQIDERPTGVFGKDVEDVEGLENFRARNILDVHEQLLSSSTWIINHTLNTDPTTHVYIDFIELDGTKSYQLMDPDDYVVEYIDQNTTQIMFATTTTGIVHSIARASNPIDDLSVVVDIEFAQITANTILTIATKEFNDQFIIKTMNFISPSTSVVTSVPVEFTAHRDEITAELALFNTPWQDTDKVFLGGSNYKVRSVRISDIISSQNIEEGSPFYFTDTSDFIILTSTSPYEASVDVATDIVFFPINISSSSTTANSNTNNNELSIDGTTAIHYHPSIKIISSIFT